MEWKERVPTQSFTPPDSEEEHRVWNWALEEGFSFLALPLRQGWLTSLKASHLIVCPSSARPQPVWLQFMLRPIGARTLLSVRMPVPVTLNHFKMVLLQIEFKVMSSNPESTPGVQSQGPVGLARATGESLCHVALYCHSQILLQSVSELVPAPHYQDLPLQPPAQPPSWSPYLPQRF